MATNTNRKNGLRFETELCETLGEHGWWAHDMAQSAAGQPADIIAVRHNTAVIIDCKVCTGDRFQLSRVEPNQLSAMTLWVSRWNEHAYFAVKYCSGDVYMIHSNEINFLQHENVSSIPEAYAKRCYKSLEQWLDIMEDMI